MGQAFSLPGLLPQIAPSGNNEREESQIGFVSQNHISVSAFANRSPEDWVRFAKPREVGWGRHSACRDFCPRSAQAETTKGKTRKLASYRKITHRSLPSQIGAPQGIGFVSQKRPFFARIRPGTSRRSQRRSDSDSLSRLKTPRDFAAPLLPTKETSVRPLA
jgi:hypothetical protein